MSSRSWDDNAVDYRSRDTLGTYHSQRPYKRRPLEPLGQLGEGGIVSGGADSLGDLFRGHLTIGT